MKGPETPLRTSGRHGSASTAECAQYRPAIDCRASDIASASGAGPARVCLIYDCLYPYTVGGAERWYRNVGERLSREGHAVVFLTLRQWAKGERIHIPGIEVRAVGPRMSLYKAGGQRRILPPLVFGLGVFWHLLRHGLRYDVVHTASFPYFSLLAAGLLRRLWRYRLIVDWHEVWSRAYWTEYLGARAGRIGWLVQGLCLRLRQQAFCFARLTAGRLRQLRVRGPVTVLEGEYAGRPAAESPTSADSFVMFAGRHIPEKRAVTIVPAVALARRRIPALKAYIFGDGPSRGEVLTAIRAHGLDDVIVAPGFVPGPELADHLRRALCLILPSAREGYGMVVIEAAAVGVPTILVRGEDNAAVELIEEGINGFVADSTSPDDLAQAIARIYERGWDLRLSTADWFVRNARRLALATSLETVVRAYALPAEH